MAQNNLLQIIIEAVNNASKEVNKIENDVKDLGDAADEAGNEANKSGGKWARLKAAALSAANSAGIATAELGELGNAAMALGPQILGAVVAVTLLIKGFQALARFMKDSIQVYGEYERAMMGLSSVTGALGVNQKEARNAALSLANDGLLTVTQSATGLKNLMASEFNFTLEQATNLMMGLKDAAAFNRQGTLEYGEAIVGATQGLKNLNSIMVDNAGLTTNLSVITRRVGVELRNVGNEAQDSETQLQLYNEIMKELALFQGDAAIMADTFYGSLRRLNRTVEKLQVEIGSYLQPVVESLTKWLQRASEIAIAGTPAFKVLAYGMQTLASAAMMAANTFIYLFDIIASGFEALKTMSFKPLEDAMVRHVNRQKKVWKEFNEALIDIGETGIDDIARNMVDKLGGAADDTAQKTADALEKYQHAVEKATEDHERSLERLAIKHRETYEQLKEDIESEEKAYKESLKGREKEFETIMKDMAERHADKTQSILDDIQDERDAMQGQIDDISGEWNSLISLTQEAGAIRIANLEKQLAKEVALGENADQEKIASLEEYIANAKASLEEAEQNQEQAKQSEIDEVKNATEEKIAELEQELAEEKENYQESVQDKKEAYQEDVENYREAHEEKLSELKEKLAEEKEIRERHRKLFDEIGDKQMQDDITRLKESHERRLEELKYQYEKQVESMGKAGHDGGKSWIDGVNDGIEEGKPQLDETLNGIEQNLGNVINTASRLGFSSGYREGSGGGGGGSWGSTSPINEWASLFGLQHGGIVSKPSIVGEKNYPEAVLPLGEPGRMNQILKSLGNTNMGERKVEQHFHITVKRESDIDMIMEKAAFNMKYK